MNFISWSNKKILNEQAFFNRGTLLEEQTLSKILKPITAKLQKLNIGLPYRDSRLLFFNFLRDRYPEFVPVGFETRKPNAKDVNAIAGQIAAEYPETFNNFETEFESYAKEEVGAGMDRVSEFLNTAASFRHERGVRPKAGEGGVKRDFSNLKVADITAATYDAIEKVKEIDPDDVGDGKLLLRAALTKVLTLLSDLDTIPAEVLINIADAGKRINSVGEFQRLIHYMNKMPEYTEAGLYLQGMVDAINDSMGSRGGYRDEEEDIYERHEKSFIEPSWRRSKSSNVTLKKLFPDESDFHGKRGFNDLDEYSDFDDFDDFDDEDDGGQLVGTEDGECMKRDEDEQIAMSPQEINRQMAAQYRQKLQNAHRVERRYTLGY